jgi:hypothetical protein
MAKIEAHLGSELADCSRARPVPLANTRRHDVADEVQVLVLLVLAARRSCGDLRAGCALAFGALLDEHLELILDRVLFFDAIHWLAPCVEPTYKPLDPRKTNTPCREAHSLKQRANAYLHRARMSAAAPPE